MLTVDGRVRGMASDEVGGGEESNDDQMRLSSRNQFPSLTLLSLLCACDLTPGRKMAVMSQSIISAFQDKKKGKEQKPKCSIQEGSPPQKSQLSCHWSILAASDTRNLRVLFSSLYNAKGRGK